MSYIGCCNLLDANLCGETQGKHFAANFVVKGVGIKTRMPLFYVYLPHTIFQKQRVAYVSDFLPT